MEKKFKSQNNLSRLPIIPSDYRKKHQEYKFNRNSGKYNLDKHQHSIKSLSQDSKKLVIDMREQKTRPPTPNDYLKPSANDSIQFRVANHKILKDNLAIGILKPFPIHCSPDSEFFKLLINQEKNLKSFYETMRIYDNNL
jgi:hypothetical protein